VEAKTGDKRFYRDVATFSGICSAERKRNPSLAHCYREMKFKSPMARTWGSAVGALNFISPVAVSQAWISFLFRRANT